MKRFCTLYILVYIVALAHTTNGIAKNPPHPTIKCIIWDAGSSLTTISKFGIAREMGVRNIARMLWHLGGQKTVRGHMLECLEQYAGKQKPACADDILSNDDSGKPLPHFMSDTWLCSRISNKKLIHHVDKAVDRWEPKKEINDKQRMMVKKVLKTALSAEILGKHTFCPRQALSLVRKFYDNGYRQYVLSNFDTESFNKAYESEVNQEVFGLIPKDNIVISGECRMIKPYRCIFEYFLKKYSLNPQECLLIDDQLENLKVARSYGIRGIHIKNSNYRHLAKKLKEYSILP